MNWIFTILCKTLCIKTMSVINTLYWNMWFIKYYFVIFKFKWLYETKQAFFSDPKMLARRSSLLSLIYIASDILNFFALPYITCFYKLTIDCVRSVYGAVLREDKSIYSIYINLLCWTVTCKIIERPNNSRWRYILNL